MLAESTEPCADKDDFVDVQDGKEVSIGEAESVGFGRSFVMVLAASTRPQSLEVNNAATWVNMLSAELIATASGAVKARLSRGLLRRHQVVDPGVIGPRASN